ncbi:MAG: ABC transporter permease [Candidatus Aminicenantes bacterium]|nr:ABC transporter permease [Candidatus Aminicenantes bacterium]
MFKNYLKITLRNIKRHKSYSFINIAGLAIGIASCILILLWVQDELSYDKYHEYADDLHIVATSLQFGKETGHSTGAPPAVAPSLKAEYPEIINSGRIQNGSRSMLIRYGEKLFRERIRFGESSLFQMFSFPLIKGDPQSVLDAPHSLAMSEDMASKYFGEEDPLGKIVTVDNTYDFTVTGVFENIAPYSSLRFNFIASFEFLRELIRENFIDTWSNCSFINFVQLDPNTDYREFSQKISGRVKTADKGSNITLFLAPYKNLRLHGLMGRSGRIPQVRMFGIIAFLILLIACINFMNLSTARSGNRAKEVGMRKVVGAQRKDIIWQFFGEAGLMSFIALALALSLAQLFLPAFEKVSGKSLSLFSNVWSLAGIFCITLLAGLFAGSYPAILLSSFKPVEVLKGTLQSGASGGVFRKVLVVAQFSISIALIIGTVVIFKQLNFLNDRDIGLNKEHIVYIPLSGNLAQTAEIFKGEMLRHQNIHQVTLSSHVPTGVYWNGNGWNWEGRLPDVDPLVTYMGVDLGFIETFQMEMADGRFYSPDSRPDTLNVVVNENFARLMGEESPVGKQISQEDDKLMPRVYTVVGVIKDFHFKPLYEEIGPILLFFRQKWIAARYMFMRIGAKNVEQAMAHIEKAHIKFNPDFPFQFRFLDEDYDNLYRGQAQFGKIVRYFAGLAIFISCLGLFGMASFMAQQRTKEIGIRKVLGASVSRIVLLLTKEFAKWVLVANIIAWPVGYILMRNWLQNYPYRISIGVTIFLFSAVATLGIALLTVGFQAVKAAVANPADSIRYE